MAATPTAIPGVVYKPRSTPASPGGARKRATNGRPFRRSPAGGPSKPPSWPEEHPGPEPRAPRRNRPQVPRTEAPGRAPRAADRAGTSLATAPCPPRGPAPAERTRGRSPGSGPRRALTSPRRRAWAAAALRLAVVEAGAGKEERGPRRRASPRRDRGHRTAAAPPPPQLARWLFAGRGRLIPASDSGAPRSGAAALAGRAVVACVSLPPPTPLGPERPRVRSGGQLRGAGPKGGRSARAPWRSAPQRVWGGVGPLVSQVTWSGGQGAAKHPSAIMRSGGRPQGLSAADAVRPRAGRAILGKTDKPRPRVTPEVPA